MSGLKGLLNRLPSSFGAVLGQSQIADGTGLRTVKETDLFVKTDPAVDGDDCTHACASCSVKYPAKFEIDEKLQLYGHITAFDRHILIATGRTDWKHTISEEQGSIAQALDASYAKLNGSDTKITTSNIPIPKDSLDLNHHETVTRLLVLPAFIYIDNVTPSNTPELITSIINNTSTNTQPISTHSSIPTSLPTISNSSVDLAAPALRVHACPHDYLVLLCSHKTRDARCGQSAPLIKKELERHLRPLGLQRDLDDDRPGGVGIYFISHVGGHKFAANVFVYRRAGTTGAAVPAVTSEFETNGTDAEVPTGEKVEELKGTKEGPENGMQSLELAEGIDGDARVPVVEAAQCIWLARIRPEDCENLVKYTILQGKVVKPESQLRGGFDRCKQLASW